MAINKKENQIYVSVILPSLNVVQYIRECMESVLNQTMSQIEVLCVDAGSTDGTLEILKEYASRDARVHLIESKKKSYGYQMNLGIQAAKGQYVGIVETDDFIELSMFHDLYSYAGNGYPDFIRGGYYDYAEFRNRKIYCMSCRNGLRHIFGKCINLRQEREKGFLELNHIWAGIYRRDFLLEKGIRFHETSGASYQDTGFFMLVGLLADTGVYIEESYYYYRRDNGRSSVKSSDKWRCVIDELRYVEGEMVRRGEYSPEAQQILWTYKPFFYFWNFLRLPQRERKWFVSEIYWELEKYTGDDIFFRPLSEGRKKMIEIMKNQEASEAYFAEQKELEEKYKRLLEIAERMQKCVLVSAGGYGESMLHLQEAAGIRYIDAVADNNPDRQGSMWNGYNLISIPEAVRRYGKLWFVIANRRYAREIKSQLTEAGISSEKILVFDEVLSLDRVIELLEANEGA